MIATYDKPIPFTVSDMLRGKCMFSDIHRINQCCTEIRKEVEAGGKVKIIEIDNRLQKQNSDLVLKLLYGNVIAELQLVIDLESAEYEFAHKLYELVRSKFFTQLAQLTVLSDKLTEEYCREAGEVIRVNTQAEQAENYQQKASFDEVKKHWG